MAGYTSRRAVTGKGNRPPQFSVCTAPKRHHESSADAPSVLIDVGRIIACIQRPPAHMRRMGHIPCGHKDVKTCSLWKVRRASEN